MSLAPPPSRSPSLGQSRPLSGGRSDRPGRRWARADVVSALLTVFAAALVSQLGVSQRVQPQMLLYVLPLLWAAVLFLRHPKWCVVGVVAGAVFGTYRSGLDVGLFTLRPSDVPLVLLAGWAVHLRHREGRRPASRIGQLQLALLLLVFGFTILTTLGDPTGVLGPFSSWLRLVCTFLLVWLMPYSLRGRDDRTFLLRALSLLATAELFRAMFFQARDGGRLGGANGPDVEGLLAVLLLVCVLNLPLFTRNFRMLMGLLAIVAVVQSKSIGSVAALAVVLGVYGLQFARARSARADWLVRPARAVVLVFGGFLLAATLRPDDLPRGESFNASSAAVRLTLAYAGLEVFVHNPVLGVGWQRSSTAIGTEAVVTAVRDRFPHIRQDLLIVGDDNPTVHNAYVQVLAESGMLGFAILAAGLVVGRRNVRALIASAGPDVEMARTLMVCIVVVLIWWNDNPLFGSQPETVLFAFFLGLLASIRPQRAGTDAAHDGPEPVSIGAVSIGAGATERA